MNNSSVPCMNLIPEEYLQRRKCAVWKARWTAAVVCTTFVVGIPGLYISVSSVLTDPEVATQIENANTELTSNQQQIPVLQSQLEALAAEQEVLDLVRNRVEWSEVFAMLITTAGDDIRFRKLNAQGGGVEGNENIEISLDGLAPSQTVARAYLVELEATGVFDSVDLIETTRERAGEFDMIGFRILITVTSGDHRMGGAGNAG